MRIQRQGAAPAHPRCSKLTSPARLSSSAVSMLRFTAGSVLRRPLVRAYARAAPSRPPGVALARKEEEPSALDAGGWTKVTAKDGGVYHWNKSTGETTAVGETVEQRLKNKAAMEQYNAESAANASAPPPSFARQMLSFAGFGAGVAAAFTVVGAVFSEPNHHGDSAPPPPADGGAA